MNRFFILLITGSISLFLATTVFALNQLHFQIVGVDSTLLTNIQSKLDLDKNSNKRQLTLTEVHQLFRQSPAAIREAIAPYGYFKPQIHERLIQRGQVWFAVITIIPGPPLLITQITLLSKGSGEHNHAINRFIQRFPIKVGDRFQAPTYEQAKSAFLQIANDQGYLKATLTKSQVLINLKTYQATIVLELTTGPRYYFGPFIFGHSPYDASFLQRFNIFCHHEPFSSQKLLSLQQQMSNSPYFSQVALTPLLNQTSTQSVPIQAETTASPLRKYSFGAGYGTLTGPRLTASTSFNRLTTTGQHFDAQLRLSSVIYGLAAKYYIPGPNPLTDQWIIGTNYEKFTPANGNSNARSLDAGYTQKRGNWQSAIDLNFLLERFSVYNLPNQTSKLFYPSASLIYLKTDDKINPKNGRYFNLTIQGTPESDLSTTSFAQVDLKGKYKFTPISFAHIMLRGEIGLTGVHNLPVYPLTTRFFAGGLNSVRGYKDYSIGPGKYLGFGSIEYQNQIKGPWLVAVFFDQGTATNHIGTPYSKGEGVGVIYESLIGPIKLYLARAISKPSRPHSLEFSLGPDF